MLSLESHRCASASSPRFDGSDRYHREEVLRASALEPFPIPVGTLDAIHLPAMESIRSHGVARLVRAARLLGIRKY